MWRKRLRWLVPVGLLLIAVAAGLVLWYSRSDELTAEEQPFVGWWKASALDPNTKSVGLSPIETVASEYRPDRTIHSLKRNTQTGEVFIEESVFRWHVSAGQLTSTTRHPYPVSSILSGDFQLTIQTVYRITWDGPDRYMMDRVDLPPGITWPTTVRTRCDPPVNP